MNWSAVKAIAAVLGVVLLVGGIVYSAGGEKGRRDAVASDVQRVEHRIDQLEAHDRDQENRLARMAESIEWIREWLSKRDKIPNR